MGTETAQHTWHQHRRYHMTCDEFDELYRRAGGRCEICGATEQELGGEALRIDHDPAAGPWAVRGLLCNRCNSGFHTSVVTDQQRARYLANAWYLSYPQRPVRPAEEPPEVELLLLQLDNLTAKAAKVGVAPVREALGEAIVAALRAGATPSEVTRRSPYSEATVRTLRRIAGIPPATRGPAKRYRIR